MWWPGNCKLNCNLFKIHWWGTPDSIPTETIPVTKSVRPQRNMLHTHTHPFNGPWSRTNRGSRYQKGKTILDFTEARDSEWQWHQLGRMQVCTSLQSVNHASIPPLFFTGWMPFLPPNQQRQSTEGWKKHVNAAKKHLYCSKSKKVKVCNKPAPNRPTPRILLCGAAGGLCDLHSTRFLPANINAKYAYLSDIFTVKWTAQ